MTIPRELYDEIDNVHGMVTNAWAMRGWPGQGNLVGLLGEAVDRFTAAMTKLSRYRGEFLRADGSDPMVSHAALLADAIVFAAQDGMALGRRRRTLVQPLQGWSSRRAARAAARARLPARGVARKGGRPMSAANETRKPLHPLVAYFTGALWMVLGDRASRTLGGVASLIVAVNQMQGGTGELVPELLVTLRGGAVLRVRVELVEEAKVQ